MRHFTWIGQFVALLILGVWLIGCGSAPATFSPAPATSSTRSPGITGSTQTDQAAANNNTLPLQSSPDLATAPAKPAEVEAWPQHITEVVTLPQQFTSTGLDQMAGACVKAVNLASALNSGQTTTAGTLRQGADGNYTYEPSPADALHLIDVTGSSAKFVITALTGNLANIEDFLRSDHTVQCALSDGATLELEVASAKEGQQQERRIRGTFTTNGQALSLDLSVRGTVRRDGDSFSKKTDQRTVGEIKFGDVAIRVDETYAEQGASALTTKQVNVSSQWTEGAAQYQLQNMFYDIAFDLNGPSEFNTWQAQGVLASRGAPIGQIGLKSTGSTIELFAEGNGGRTVLNSWSQ